MSFHLFSGSTFDVCVYRGNPVYRKSRSMFDLRFVAGNFGSTELSVRASLSLSDTCATLDIWMVYMNWLLHLGQSTGKTK